MALLAIAGCGGATEGSRGHDAGTFRREAGVQEAGGSEAASNSGASASDGGSERADGGIVGGGRVDGGWFDAGAGGSSSSGSSSSGSSSSGSSSSGSVDASAGSDVLAIDGAGDGDAGGSLSPFDRTTGKRCQSDADCKGTQPGAPGVNVCSNSASQRYSFSGVVFGLHPTPVCIVPASPAGNCDPCGGAVPCDQNLHFCDGPDDLSAPGLCLPMDSNNPVPGRGTCVPYCTMANDGGKPVGCAGHDRCSIYTWTLVSPPGGGAPVVTGIGVCQGGCESDADCSDLGAGFVCQTDLGFCTQGKVARSKPVGAPCLGGASATSDTATGACYCLGNTTSNAGYCTSSCVVGGVACPPGFLCDAIEQSGPLAFGNDAGAPPLSRQNVGAEGLCVAACSVVADAGAVDAAGAHCPPNSTCQALTLAGPDCLP